MTPTQTVSSLQGSDDATLARRAAGGSREAFAVLVERYGGRLLSFLERRVRSPEDAEDFAHEAMLRAWKAIDRYDPRWRFSTWLFTIALRLARDESRRRRPILTTTDLNPATSADATQGILERREASRNLWAVAEAVLHEDERTALWLRYADEHSAAEIGQVLDRSEAAVRILLSRARQRLRRAMEAAETAPGVHQNLNGARPRATLAER